METKPRFILGLFTFAPSEYHGGRMTDLDDLKTALDIFKSRGYTELDTARSYGGGTQEGFTREAGWTERELRIATKLYPASPLTHKRDDVIGQVNISLGNLGTDCVDIIYLHPPDRNTPFSETLQALDVLHKAGKFKQLGLSNFSAFEVAEIVTTCKYNNWIRPTVYQGLYNCMTRSVEDELLPACRRYGLDFVAYAPTAGGFLSGKYTKNEMPTEGRFSDGYIRGQWSRDRYFQDSNFEAVEIVRYASEKHGLTMIEVALRWLVHHSKLRILSGGNDGTIVGTSKLEHLAVNLDYFESGPLPDAVVQALEKAWLLAKPQCANYWHGELEYTYTI